MEDGGGHDRWRRATHHDPEGGHGPEDPGRPTPLYWTLAQLLTRSAKTQRGHREIRRVAAHWTNGHCGRETPRSYVASVLVLARPSRRGKRDGTDNLTNEADMPSTETRIKHDLLGDFDVQADAY